jgi:CHASE2 domain-containing sensor protein
MGQLATNVVRKQLKSKPTAHPRDVTCTFALVACLIGTMRQSRSLEKRKNGVVQNVAGSVIAAFVGKSKAFVLLAFLPTLPSLLGLIVFALY